MEIRLDGKVAFVTGAGRGIGKAIALELARSGADVAVNYLADRVKAEEVCEKVKRMGRQSIAIRADVADSSQVNEMVETVAHTFGGRLDILVSNAGVYPIKEAVKMTDEEWDRVIDTNLKGAFHACRAAAKQMIQRGAGGRIIGIASGAGHSGRYGQTHYCASKAGLILLCKSLSIELAPYGINVNTISVGFVDVGQFDSPELGHVKKDILRRILLRRPGRPEDIAQAAVFLASDQASWITGADFRVDGGEAAGRVPESNI
jgi:NAD(P)-dependent dehydrogenase (short-subunit alcohol dehydrogenase family)